MNNQNVLFEEFKVSYSTVDVVADWEDTYLDIIDATYRAKATSIYSNVAEVFVRSTETNKLLAVYNNGELMLNWEFDNAVKEAKMRIEICNETMESAIFQAVLGTDITPEEIEARL